MSGISINKNRLYFGNKDVLNFIKNKETPLFLFSQTRFEDNYKAFLGAFKKYYKKTYIYYSVKTNYEPKMLNTLFKLGSGVEVASALEAKISLNSGFNPKDIIVDGPCWTDEDIEYFIKNGVSTLNVDSIEEMERVSKIAVKLKKTQRVGFRIFPEMPVSLLKSFIESYISKFGIPISKAIDAYKYAQTLPNLQVCAVSTHIGSMITDPSYYEKTLDRLVKLAFNLKKNLNIEVEEINLGGGYGVQSLNYYSIQNIILNKVGVSMYGKAATIEEFGKRIATRFAQNVKKYKLKEINLFLEPGRFIASDSGILVTKVMSVKDNWVFINGGINIVPESIFFIRRGFIVANKLDAKPTQTYNIAGPTLSTSDVVSTNQKMPRLELGDIIIVLDAGAYTLSRSNQFTVLRPDVFFIDAKGNTSLLRKKEVHEDFLKMLTFK